MKVFLVLMALMGLLGAALLIFGASTGAGLPRLIPWKQVMAACVMIHG